MTPQQEEQYLGIDVSGESISAALYPCGQTWTASRTQEGLEGWVAGLPSGIALAVLEASGGYETLPAAALADAGIPVAVVNPRQVRGFADALNLKAKSDRIDAQLIARFAHMLRPHPKSLNSEEQTQFKELLSRRSQLVKMQASEKARIGKVRNPQIMKSIMEHIEWIAAELARIDKDLDSCIKASPLWKAKENILKSVPGVGKLTARCMMADMPELGTMSRKQVASLAGLAPFVRQSGAWKGHSFITGGRAGVRCALYMATMSAIRCNPAIRSFYERLVARGKPKKLAITACMRKLLTILNTLLLEQRMWKDSLLTT